MVSALERTAIISGIGQSAVGRRLGRTGLDLTLEAILAALTDAGLDRSQIDGVASWPGYRADMPAFSPVSIGQVKEALGLELNWYCAGNEATQMSGLINACMAVASGQARHVLCFRTVTESSALAQGVRSSTVGGSAPRVSGFGEFLVPFQATSAANWVALAASRYFHEFGTRRDQLAAIALNARRNAMLNPKAVYRDPLSLDQYMSTRMISTPLCLFDCDVPVDGATVLIVSHRDTAPDLRSKPVFVESICGPFSGRDAWDQMDDLTRYSAEACGKRLWSRTDYKPADVDVAELYDGFSFLTLLWLEGLGFCGRGEAAAFVEGGQRIALDGELPLATHGGQLSAGRLHGLGHVHEAVVQLRGEGEARQVPGQPKLAVASNGGGPLAGAVLLSRE
ncbi:thiolase family protein [Pseudomonas aeruginosa]|uniref:thiolase family protein n=1 Tax=Pseudomonas aeruginosa TaxID=287 RepID=UPI00071BC2CD|nr:thiolase family protein [Pseudomonas aeruginosa]KSE28057.1 DitF protein [Pseudomonas aeruginosa]KSG99957.1 DitF protein [Pseudomonas aeruginosa]KSS49696.1 DitF protein [Pseudomonas aeruginosa]MBA5113628.1 thiolase family protein [Pseudomonas aeruginosa]OWI78572.1 DitF protein [Pseudomonas aeruginosa]